MRAARPVVGVDHMRARRGGAADRELLRGPAKLCAALAITGALSGHDLCSEGPLEFREDGDRPARTVAGPRVGVSVAADVPWRFYEPDSRWVSSYRRSPRAPRPGAVDAYG